VINQTLINITTTSTKPEIAEAVFKIVKPLLIIIFVIVMIKILFTNIYLIIKAAKSRSKKPFGNYFTGILLPDIFLILILIIIWFLAPMLIQMF